MATAAVAQQMEVEWRIVPLETPRVWRHCATCGTVQGFRSSDQFRLNAHHRKIDVWLIYRCLSCDTTWNCTIFTRSSPDTIGADLYQRFVCNDQTTAWQYAFDRSLLRRCGVHVEDDVEVAVAWTGSAGPSPHERHIRIVMSYPCSIRLDKLLARELCVSRSCLLRWFKTGLVQIHPADKQALRKPVRDGQLISLGEEAAVLLAGA